MSNNDTFADTKVPTGTKITKPVKILIFKILILILVVVALFHSIYLTDTPQIDMRVIVTVLGIDTTPEGRYITTAHILVPVSANEKISGQDIIESEGESLTEALDNFNITNGTKVEISQCGMVIFGKSISQKDIITPMKTLMSAGKISAGVIVISADKLQAKEFLEKYSKMSEESSSNVNNFVSFFENSLYMPTLTISKLLSESVNESGASFIPCIDLKENVGQEGKSSGSGTGNNEGGGENSKSPSVSKTKIENIGRIIVIRDGFRIGVLGADEAQGLAWTQSRSKKGFVQIDKFNAFGREYESVCGDVINKKTKISYEFENGKPKVKFKVRALIYLIDRHMFTYDLDKANISSREHTLMLDGKMSDKIRSEIDAAVNAARRLDSDFMSLKYYFYRLKAKEMKQFEENPYNDFFRDLEVEYDIKCDVR